MASITPPLRGKVKRDARRGFDRYRHHALVEVKLFVVVTGAEFSAENHVRGEAAARPTRAIIRVASSEPAGAAMRSTACCTPGTRAACSRR